MHSDGITYNVLQITYNDLQNNYYLAGAYLGFFSIAWKPLLALIWAARGHVGGTLRVLGQSASYILITESQ